MGPFSDAAYLARAKLSPPERRRPGNPLVRKDRP